MQLTRIGLTPKEASNPTQPTQIRHTAQQFEALLIEQMLRSARESGGTESDNALLQVAEQHFAQLIAANGGLGIARLLEGALQSSTPAQKRSIITPALEAIR